MVESLPQPVLDLLAVLNGDGGQFLDANGVAPACKAAEEKFYAVLAEIDDMEKRKDGAYLERNQVVAALAKAFPSGTARTAIEGWSEDWHGCVYIDLPTGQASWHYHDSHAYLFADLPPYARPWDGHTTEQKYARLAALPLDAKNVDSARCVAARNALWAALEGAPAVLGSLEEAVDTVSTRVAYLTDHRKRMHADLELAAETFRRYEKLHRAKLLPDAEEKANVNAALAERIEATINNRPHP